MANACRFNRRFRCGDIVELCVRLSGLDIERGHIFDRGKIVRGDGASESGRDSSFSTESYANVDENKLSRIRIAVNRRWTG